MWTVPYHLTPVLVSRPSVTSHLHYAPFRRRGDGDGRTKRDRTDDEVTERGAGWQEHRESIPPIDLTSLVLWSVSFMFRSSPCHSSSALHVPFTSRTEVMREGERMVSEVTRFGLSVPCSSLRVSVAQSLLSAFPHSLATPNGTRGTGHHSSHLLGSSSSYSLRLSCPSSAHSLLTSFTHLVRPRLTASMERGTK